MNISSAAVLIGFSQCSVGYIKNEMPKKAIDVFNRVRDPNEVLFTLLFNACAKLGDDERLKLIRAHSSSLPSSWTSNVRLSTSLMDALIKCGDCESAERIFPTTSKSVISYGNLMNGFNDAKQPEKTLNLYADMKRSAVTRNEIIFLLVIKALSQVRVGRIARDIVGEMPKQMQTHRSIQTSLISMWVSYPLKVL